MLTVCCVLLMAVNLQAQPKGYAAVNDMSTFRKKISETAAGTQTIRSNFTQEKNLNVLSEKITSKGTFRFKKQNKVRMEYTQPYKYLLVINNDKVMIRDEQKSNSFSSKSNKLFTLINNIIIDCVQGTALDNKDFKPAVFSNDKNYLLVLTPVNKDLKGFFESISVFLEIKDGSVFKIDMLEPSGDNTVITFTQKETNVPIADTEFTVR
jgi:outer membrane lipoprotein-sorting protein